MGLLDIGWVLDILVPVVGVSCAKSSPNHMLNVLGVNGQIFKRKMMQVLNKYQLTWTWRSSTSSINDTTLGIADTALSMSG